MVIARDAPRALRVQFVGAVFAFAVAGCLALWMGLGGLLGVLGQSSAGVPTVAFRPLYLAALPLALTFWALAVLALLPTPAPRRGRPAPRPRGAGVVFGLAMAGVLGAIAAPLVGRGAVESALEVRGYRACAPSPDERRPPMRWVRPPARCPG